MKAIEYALCIQLLMVPYANTLAGPEEFDVSSPATGEIIYYSLESGVPLPVGWKFLWEVEGATRINGKPSSMEPQKIKSLSDVIIIEWGNPQLPRSLTLSLIDPATNEVTDVIGRGSNSPGLVGMCPNLSFEIYDGNNLVNWEDVCAGVLYDIVVKAQGRPNGCFGGSSSWFMEMTVFGLKKIYGNNGSQGPWDPPYDSTTNLSFCVQGVPNPNPPSNHSYNYMWTWPQVEFAKTSFARVKWDAMADSGFPQPTSCKIKGTRLFHPWFGGNWGNFKIRNLLDPSSPDLKRCQGQDVPFKSDPVPGAWRYEWSWDSNPNDWNLSTGGALNPVAFVNNDGNPGPSKLKVEVFKGDGNGCHESSIEITQNINAHPEFSPEDFPFGGLDFDLLSSNSSHCLYSEDEVVELDFDDALPSQCPTNCNSFSYLSQDGFVKGIWSISSPNSQAKLKTFDYRRFGSTALWTTRDGNKATIKYGGAEYVDVTLDLEFTCGTVASNPFRIVTKPLPDPPDIDFVEINGPQEGYCEGDIITLEVDQVPGLQPIWTAGNGLEGASVIQPGNRKSFEITAGFSTGSAYAEYSSDCGNSSQSQFVIPANPTIGVGVEMQLLSPVSTCAGSALMWKAENIEPGSYVIWDIQADPNKNIPQVIGGITGTDLTLILPSGPSDFTINCIGMDCDIGSFIQSESYSYNKLPGCENAQERLGRFENKDLESKSLEVFPNPIYGDFEVRVGDEPVERFQIMDLQGITLYESNNRSPYHHVSGLIPNGTYIIRGTSKDKWYTRLIKIENR